MADTITTEDTPKKGTPRRLTVHQRIMDAARRGVGLHWTTEETLEFARLPIVQQLAAKADAELLGIE